MVPEGWKKARFSEVATIANGQVDPRIEPYSEMLHIGPENVSAHTGQVTGCKTGKELGLISGKYEFDEEAIVYSKIRPSLNKVCRPRSKGLCSADMYPIWPTSEVSADYLYQYMLSEHFCRAAVAMSMRTGMPKINRSDLNSIRVLYPPLSEQKRISQVLSAWDEAITTTERLIEVSQQQKNALMQQLLTGKRRLPGFEGEWGKVELKEALDYQQPGQFIVKSTEYSNNYKTPVLTAGKSFVLGYSNEEDGVYDQGLPVIIFDDFTTASRLVGFPFKLKSSAIKILTSRPGFSVKYFFEAMQMIPFVVGGHQRHWISIFSNLVIPCPSFEEQKAIAEVLSQADAEIEAQQLRLDCLRQEKKALMQQLLTGKRRVKVEATAPTEEAAC